MTMMALPNSPLHDDLGFSEIPEFQVKKNEVGALLQVRIFL
jgi:hypothetical protein